MEKRIQEILEELKELEKPMFLSKVNKKEQLEKELKELKFKLLIKKYRK